MTDFNKTSWSRKEFIQQYIDNADIYIVERQRMLGLMVSYYLHFIRTGPGKSILDLGCGDGILTHRLLSIDRELAATLIDGSEEMLSKAATRLEGLPSVRAIRASFQEMLGTYDLEGDYDFIVSSMAIHHLTMDEKKRLFKLSYDRLREGGHFLNIDVVLPPSDSMEEWYLKIWQEWMDAERTRLGLGDDPFDDVIRRYKDNEDNKPDTLEAQLDALKESGLSHVDCYYKYGIFVIYGGRKEPGSR